MTSPLDPKNHGSDAANQDGSFASLPGPGDPSFARRLIAGRYEVLSHLGRGGMGEVWHAYDTKLRVDVALKSIRLDRVEDFRLDLKRHHIRGSDTLPRTIRRERDPMELLRREVRSAREVISPNVCRVFDLVVDDDSELISME
jgi:serine/threonine protein kinase